MKTVLVLILCLENVRDVDNAAVAKESLKNDASSSEDVTGTDDLETMVTEVVTVPEPRRDGVAEDEYSQNVAVTQPDWRSEFGRRQYNRQNSEPKQSKPFTKLGDFWRPKATQVSEIMDVLYNVGKEWYKRSETHLFNVYEGLFRIGYFLWLGICPSTTRVTKSRGKRPPYGANWYG